MRLFYKETSVFYIRIDNVTPTARNYWNSL